MRFFIFIISAVLAALPRPAQTVPTAAQTGTKSGRVVCTRADSAEVVRLLRLPVQGNDVLFFARQFLGRPYVAHTLEGHDPERLVVNLRGLDCTTFVETVYALTLTKRQNSDSFSDFCHNLESLRYRGGKMNGYLSRLHYFTWWMHDNAARGNVAEVRLPEALTAPLYVRNHYMSRHPQLYGMLRRHPEWTDSIAAQERQANGSDGSYLREGATAGNGRQLAAIHDGDLIAIVTTKDGLDYSHLGLAVWGKDGRLHMMHASTIYKRVVEDRTDLYTYLKRQRQAVGIRVFRLAK